MAQIVSLLLGLVEITEGRMAHHLCQLALGDFDIPGLFCRFFQCTDSLEHLFLAIGHEGNVGVPKLLRTYLNLFL